MGARLAALAALAASGLYLWHALGFPLGTVAAPGAGFFPVATGTFLVLVTAVLTVQAFRRRLPGTGARLPPDEGSPAGAWKRVATAMAGLVGFCALLPWAGYPVAAFAFVTVLLGRLGGGGWAGAVLGGLLTAVLSHYLFTVLLGVPLPRGLFGP
jgi:hypothetical protein